MAIAPPGGGGRGMAPAPIIPFGPHPSPRREGGPSSRSTLSDEPSNRAAEAEKDASARITIANQHLEDAERDVEARMSKIKEDYAEEAIREAARSESSINAQKNKGYEQIRDLQRAQQAELNKARLEGERDLKKTQDYFRDTIYSTQRKGEEDLGEISRQHHTQAEHESRVAAMELEGQRDQFSRQMQGLIEERQAALMATSDASHKEYDRIRSNSEEAIQSSEQHYQEQFDRIHGAQKEALDRLYGRASQRIRDIRSDYSQKLSAYATRSADPFYKMASIGAKLDETSDGFILTATIPEHEQKGVTVSLKGSNLVISGYRRNQERLDERDGRSTQSSSYQTYSESFPLSWPVDGKELRKAFDGDSLTVFVPKKLGTGTPTKSRPAATERARVETPRFPENLPTGDAPKPDPEAESPPPAERRGGSRPLLT